jgi:hypothetical protein
MGFQKRMECGSLILFSGKINSQFVAGFNTQALKDKKN